MNKIRTFEDFDRKVKELERDKIRTEEQLNRAKEELDNSLAKLKEMTGTDSIQKVLEYMKSLKDDLSETRHKLNEEINNFVEQLNDLDS